MPGDGGDRVHGTIGPMSFCLRPLGRAWSVSCAALLLVACLASAASAHASLETVAPANDSVVASVPKEVVLRFDEAVALDLGAGIRVFGPNGKRVDRSVSQLRDRKRAVAVAIDSGGSGTYTVAWRVVSEDSHVLRGSSVFHVTTKTGSVEQSTTASAAQTVIGWLARFLILAAASILLGSALLAMPSALSAHRHSLHATVAVAAALLALGAGSRFAVQVSNASGRNLAGAVSLWGEAASSTRPGSLDALRVAGSLLALLGALLWMRRLGPSLAGFGAVVSIVANSLGGHSWTASTRGGSVVADVVHQAAAAGWAGGLVALMMVLRAGGDQRSLFVERFGRIAALSAVLLFATGVRATYSLVGSIDLITSTTYGRLVLLKLVGFLAMGALGWTNRRRLRSVILDRSGTVVAEALVAALVLVVTASLVGAVPARAGSREPFYTESQMGSFVVDVTVLPAAVGSNILHLYFYDETGNPQDVDVATASIAIGDIPPRRISLVPVSGDHYSAIGFSLPLKGTWILTLQAAREGRAETITLEVPIK